mgnify:CR=1 FL=1
MEKIVLNIEAWIDIFKKIDYYREFYGSGIIKEWILYLENLKLRHFDLIIPGDNGVFNIFTKYEVFNIDVIISLLKVVTEIYRFYDVEKNYINLKEEFSIDQIAFLINEKDYIKISKGFLHDNIVYTRYGIELQEYEYYMVIRNREPFIVDTKDNRVLYTCDFNFNGLTFPSKNAMDRARKK